MTLEPQYRRAHAKLMGDLAVCSQNRRLFAEFFEFQEYKLKRQNGLQALDDACYKTLRAYIARLRTVNRWFENKPWKLLTKADIQHVYDALEDGKLMTLSGRPWKDKVSYYNKVLRGKPFEMAGKADLVREVMAFGTRTVQSEVRFITEETFRKIVETVIQPAHRALLWLCFDIGENASSILALRKRDCSRRQNSETKESEYRVNLRRETLKRSRRARSELTNYSDTVAALDAILAGLGEDDTLFTFGHRQAAKMLERAVTLTEARCLPAGQPVSLKDLRSSMACDLLSKGWTTDEVNARLGHKPSSRELDKYVNFFAMDGARPKKKLHDNQVAALTEKLEAIQHREKLYVQRQERLQAEVDELKKLRLEDNRQLFLEVRRLAERLPPEMRSAA